MDERWRDGPGIAASAWRYRWLVVGVTLLTGIAGYVTSSVQDPVYEATARLFLADPRAQALFESGPPVDPQRYIPQQAERLTSRAVLARAADALNVGPTELAERVAADGDVELAMLEVTANGPTPEEAADAANAVATAYQADAEERVTEAAARAAAELDGARAAIEAQIAELERERAAARTDDAILDDRLSVLSQRLVQIESLAQQATVEARLFGSGVDAVEGAQPPDEPTSPSPRRDAVLAALLGGMLATAGAYWRAGRARRVESRTDPQGILGAPLLGVLPRYDVPDGSSLTERIALDPRAAEAYHFLYTSLEFALSEAEARSVIVTSATSGEGKTETCLQLAVTAALEGRDVLLVDGDLRVPALTRYLDAEERPGLVDLARQPEAGYRPFVSSYHIAAEAELAVVPAGREAVRGGRLREAGFRRAIEELNRGVELTILDSAPLLAVAETSVIASSVGGIVLVIREGTSVETLEDVRDRLRFIDAPLLGYVYITRQALHAGYGYGLERAGRRVPIDTGSQRDTVPEETIRVPETSRSHPTVAAPSDPPAAVPGDDAAPIARPNGQPGRLARTDIEWFAADVEPARTGEPPDRW